MNAGDFLDRHDSCFDQVLARTHRLADFDRRPDRNPEPFASPPKKKTGKTIIIKKKA